MIPIGLVFFPLLGTVICIFLIFRFVVTNKFDLIAPFFDFCTSRMERKTLGPLRQQHIPHISGKTLDICVGTGRNIPYYPEGTEAVLVDSSSAMLKRAEKRADLFPNRRLKLNYLNRDVQRLPFPDEFFDTVVSVDCFCSLEKPERVILELNRVLKRGGKAIFIEHGLVKSRYINHRLNFLTHFLTYPLLGTHMNRDIPAILDCAFQTESATPGRGTFCAYHCRKTESRGATLFSSVMANAMRGKTE
eukprot:gnl/Trimastix_PCT/4544.p1 GENE.gnl/Trimastix_PCT/4544~~gnl/Trimastix_PCT/4544.p1  ORF type:complete len:247 (+),score=38.05 gnl/Trimastix_PCT/4544:45-785(+)